MPSELLVSKPLEQVSYAFFLFALVLIWLSTVYGLANTLSGLFGLVQWPLDVLIKLPLDGNYTPVNAVLLGLGAITSVSLATRIWLGTKPGTLLLAQ